MSDTDTTTAEKLQIIADSKSNIYNALLAAGSDITIYTPLTEYASKIEQLATTFVKYSELIELILMSNTQVSMYQDIFEISLEYNSITVNGDIYIRQADAVAKKWKSANNTVLYSSSDEPIVNETVYSDITCTTSAGTISQVFLNNQVNFIFTQSQVGKIVLNSTEYSRDRTSDTIKRFAWKDTNNNIIFTENDYSALDKIYTNAVDETQVEITSISFINPKWTATNAQVYYSDDTTNMYSIINLTIDSNITQSIICDSDVSGYLPFPINMNAFTYTFKIPIVINAETTFNNFNSENMTSFNTVKQMQKTLVQPSINDLKKEVNLLNEKIEVNNVAFASNIETYQGVVTDKAVSPANIMYVLNILIDEKVNAALTDVNTALDELNG